MATRFISQRAGAMEVDVLFGPDDAVAGGPGAGTNGLLLESDTDSSAFLLLESDTDSTSVLLLENA